VGREWIESG
jgi:hypothetical protein